MKDIDLKPYASYESLLLEEVILGAKPETTVKLKPAKNESRTKLTISNSDSNTTSPLTLPIGDIGRVTIV